MKYETFLMHEPDWTAEDSNKMYESYATVHSSNNKLNAEAMASNELQHVQLLAKKKKKKVRITKAFEPTSSMRCGDCNGSLPDGTWYVEEMVYYDEPMVRYWFPWGGDLCPAAYSWPLGEKMYLCTKCFDDREEARVKMTPSRVEAMQAAAKMAIKLDDTGPFFPGRERRRCRRCSMILTNRGWYTSTDMTKNLIPINVCWEVEKGALAPIAYQVRGPVNTYICFKCYKECDERIELC